MKILVKIQNSPTKLFLVDLKNEKLLKEIKSLILKGKRSKAAVTTLSKGVFLRELSENDLTAIEADMILTESSVHYQG